MKQRISSEYLPSVSVSSFSAYFAVVTSGHIRESSLKLGSQWRDGGSHLPSHISCGWQHPGLPYQDPTASTRGDRWWKGRRLMVQTCSPFNQIFPWPWSGAFVGGPGAISDRRGKSIMKTILVGVEPVHRLSWGVDIFASEMESKRRLNWRETLHSIFRLLNSLHISRAELDQPFKECRTRG